MKSLPKSPNLDYLKKEAKKLRASHRNRDRESCHRIRHFDTSFANQSEEEIHNSKFSLLDAQRIISREYDFSSWAKIKRFIESVNSQFNKILHTELIGLMKVDITLRQQLISEGVLTDDYHPEMEKIHIENAERLRKIIEKYGWPGTSLVGLDGCRAAWMIAQNAISLPEFQRQCLLLLKVAAEHGEASSRQVAFLTDRILFNERKPQMYGVIGDWDENGVLTYGKIVDEENVNQRRALIGLGRIQDELAEHKQELINEGVAPPKKFKEKKLKAVVWAKEVGWL